MKEPVGRREGESSPLAARLRAQLLSGPPARDPVAVAERVLAVQGQDPRGFRLAIRARSAGLTAADVDRALTEDRSLVVTWLNRGTLHLVRSEDLAWLHALTTPQLAAGSARRLAQEGMPPDRAERGIATIERALAEDGPLTGDELRERLASAGLPAAGQALYHVLFAAALRGLIVRGPMRDRKHAYVLVRDWLGEPPRVERDTALAELGRRYLTGHGPADERDLARWAGIGLRDARAALARSGRDPAAVPRRAAGALPPPKLLGAFEPVLLGWVSRSELLGRHADLVTQNGMFRPFALVDGQAAGGWRLERGRVAFEPFAPLRPEDAAGLAAEAGDVIRFIG